MGIQREEDDLVLASFGRGFFVLDNYTPLRDIPVDGIKENKIFPVKTGQMFAQVAPLAVGRRAFQGANFYTAPNPTYGAVIRYHLTESLKTKKSERQAKDRRLAAAGKDSPYPSWDDLKAEDRETAPRVWLNVRNQDGEIIRRLPGSTSKGMHEVAWDFTHESPGRGGGPTAVPGSYTVDVVKMVDGEVTQLVEPVSFEIEPITFGDTSGPDREAILEFVKRAAELGQTVGATQQVLTQAQQTLDAIKSVLQRSPQLDPQLGNEVRQLELKLMDINESFSGDPTKARRNETSYPGFMSRLRTMMFGAMGSTEGPTATHRKLPATDSE